MLENPKAGLATIPVTPISDGGLVAHAIASGDRARALRDDCIAWLPRPAQLLLPAIDGVTRRWLVRSQSPYVHEIEAIAAALGIPGIWFLNGCYQWGCTALAREEDGAPWLVRTLDWPFPGLGRHVEIARLRSDAGHHDNLTWPGYVGALTASAAGRFAACINQAPLQRRTRHPWLRLYDMAANALSTWRIRLIPPDHLLREVFESCSSYGEAKQKLETTPIARPVIYTLVGCERGERCVIERTEESFATRTDETGAANDWLQGAPGWEARVCSAALFTRSYEEAAENSRSRRVALAEWPGRFESGSFDWVVPPVLNQFTRIAVELCPAKGQVRAIGFELAPGADLPTAATHRAAVASTAM